MVNGVRWTFILYDDAYQASNDLSNLRLVSNKDNSSKGGKKGVDFPGPKFVFISDSQELSENGSEESDEIEVPDESHNMFDKFKDKDDFDDNSGNGSGIIA